MRPNRSVVDFDSEEALRRALMAVKLPSDENNSTSAQTSQSQQPQGEGSSQVASPAQPRETTMEQEEEEENLDWVLPSLDPETSEVQSMKQELHRLQVLKSYMILDAEREESFERLTRLSARFYHVPITLISLVDLGRQWFISNRGLGDVRETPRKHAFCAHAILNKHNILVVPDASKDVRFQNNPLSTGPPNIRFYAGAPLISPEGYKLGTFCIIDSKPWPAGLSQDQQSTLRDLSDMAVKELVERRNSMKRHENPAQLIAYTAHDLMTPLTGVQLSLSLLKGDEDVRERLGGHHQELLSTAANCSDLMIRICQTAIDTLRDESSSSAVPDVVTAAAKGSTPVTKLAELIKSLMMIMEPIPKTVPLIVSLDSNVPPTVMSDDLKLFRSALNLISNSVERTSLGSVHLRIVVQSGERNKLLFECTDTGPPVPVEEYQYLFRPSRNADGDLKLDLSSVATMINSLDGEYGFRPLDGSEDGKLVAPDLTGAIFWFSVPLFTPENFGVTNTDDELPISVIRKITTSTNVRRDATTLKQPIIPVVSTTKTSAAASGNDALFRCCPGATNNNSNISPSPSASAPWVVQTSDSRRNSGSNSVSSVGRRKIPVVVGDAMQAEAMNNSCFGDVFEPMAPDSKMPAVPESVSVSRVSAAGGPTTLSLGQRKRRALIIEDSLVVRKSLARALEKLGLMVTQAVNGLEGLKRMKAKIYDFVLCDFLMPIMDGLDCVKQYRDWERHNRPDICQHIVGISAHGGANDGNRGIKAGMNDFRPKPVSIKELTEVQRETAVMELSKKLDEIDQTNMGLESCSSSVASITVSEHAQLRTSSSWNCGFGISMNGQTGGKRAPPSSLSAQQNFTFDPIHVGTKRQKLEHGSSFSGDQGAPVCLLATDTPTQRSSEVFTELEQHGWKVVVVHDGQDALRLLKMRNWNAVLIDDDLPVSGGVECANEFRAWEQHNRVNRQRNVYMVCKVPVPSVFDKNSVVLPPTGCDGVLGKPVEWKQLDHLLTMKKERSLDIIVGGRF